MGRQEELGALCGHLPHGGRPFHRIALHLLRVARVGKTPDEEVTRADRLVFRDPGPRVVVGLALGVLQLDVEPADGKIQLVRIGDFRARRGFRQEPVAVGERIAAARELPELATVDHHVVAARPLIAIEAARDVLVTGDLRRRPAIGFGIRHEGTTAADVIEMPVCVHQGIEAVVAPTTDRLDYPSPTLGTAGIEGQQAVVRLEQHTVRKRLNHRDPVGDGRQLVIDPIDRPDIFRGLAFVDDGRRHG